VFITSNQDNPFHDHNPCSTRGVDIEAEGKQSSLELIPSLIRPVLLRLRSQDRGHLFNIVRNQLHSSSETSIDGIVSQESLVNFEAEIVAGVLTSE
jgi:hypothetical protein